MLQDDAYRKMIVRLVERDKLKIAITEWEQENSEGESSDPR